MPRSLHAAALAAFLAIPAAALPAAAQQLPFPGPHISVIGEGEAPARPDMAVLTLGVTREAPTAREALDANSNAMAAVIASMKAEGIEERDLQTSNFSVNPVYAYPDQNQPDRQPKITGYQVNNTLSVRLRDVAKVGAILDKAVTLGVNQGGGISFTNDDPAATLTEARKRAVKDAMDKARTLAEAAGVNLGRIVEMSEQNFREPPMPYAMKSMARDAEAQSVPVEAGENVYRVQVSVTFEISQ